MRDLRLADLTVGVDSVDRGVCDVVICVEEYLIRLTESDVDTLKSRLHDARRDARRARRAK